ncbi:MAG: GNAT family N-acetyltransferase [Fimbriimonadaceae bacterium]|nr:MAG: GNAT family N-acetyltransferase [Fimbriimonadaceae bacterium]
MTLDENYNEKYKTPDGREVTLRLVRPDDKLAFVIGLEECSPQTIYNRFMGAKPRFTRAELEYLTECDHQNHLAIVAFHGDLLIGVARAIRYKDRPEAADFGLIVADCFQRQGVGRKLLNRLIEGVSERNIQYLCAEMFATNNRVFAMIDDLVYVTDWIRIGSTVSFEIDLTTKRG